MNIEFLTLSEALNQFNILTAVGLFLLYLVIEMLDSSLTFSLTQHRAKRSAIVTFILYLMIAIEVVAIVANYLYIFPVALGAAFGSYAVVRYEMKHRPLKKDKED